MNRTELIALREYIEYHKVTAPSVLRAADALEALQAENARLEQLCQETYVAKGADAYHHACDCMEAYQSKRHAAGKEVGTQGSLCDGMEWLYSRLDSVEVENARLAAELAAIREQEPVASVYRNSVTREFELLNYAPASHPTGTHVDVYAAPVQPARAQPCQDAACQARPPTVDDNSQHWAGMDGAVAFQLIERHADNWADTAKMMGEWLAANQQPAQARELSADDVRAVGGIVHRDGNVFFTNLAMLNQAYKGAK